MARGRRAAVRTMGAVAASSPAPALVRMERDEPQFAGGPVTASVHPDEVGNWLAGGWRKVVDHAR